MKIGRASIGLLKSPTLTSRLPRAVNSSGAVSPAARATASITPVRMPASPVRRTTDRTVRQAGTPRASDASRRSFGTSRMISSVVRMMTGIIRKASATLPAKALYWWNGRTRNVKTKIAHQDRRDPDEDVGREADDARPSDGRRTRSRRPRPGSRPGSRSATPARPSGSSRGSPPPPRHRPRARAAAWSGGRGSARGAR